MSRDKNPEFTLTSNKITDAMQFLWMSGHEALGRAFSFDLEFAMENASIGIADTLDATLAVCGKTSTGYERYFHGQIAGFAYLGAIDLAGAKNRHRYRVSLRPKVWSLTRRADCRIFQDLTAPDIIKNVLQGAGLAAGDDFKLSLQGSYSTRTYCVQYRETDFNFISRLMEEEGIYYFFEHQESKHTMVLCDSPSAHQSVSGFEKIRYDAPDQQPKPDHINEWRAEAEVTPGKYTIRDYDFLKPSVLLESKSQGATFSSLEVYDYPGLYTNTGDGDGRVSKRLEEMRREATQVFGGGPVLAVQTGAKFGLTDHPRADQNGDHTVVSAKYDLESDVYQESSGKAAGMGVNIRFVAIDSNTPFRTARLTPKPFVQGPQTAVVVGPQGDDDIYTDEFGRVKVQFHWDRLGQKDDKSSCWIRVASPWAGNGWGAIQIPRLKHEVVVDFLEGDPDQPIITGRVYNADNKVPYTLPDNKTQSTIKSRSTTQGTDANFNELRFEDKKGSEEVYFHAEKDFNRVVENNDTLKVGFDKKDKGDQTLEIYNNQTVTIGTDGADDGSQTVNIWKNRTITVKNGDEKLEVSKGNREVLVDEGNDKHQVKKGNRDVLVDKGNDTHTIGQGNRTVEISQGNDTLTIKQGDQSITITAGKSTTEAGTSIELKVGGSSIKIEAAKITIKSPEIAIQADGKVSTKAPMVEVNGDATVKVQGGIVKIN
jgi:type VI secretion system secreted protein VgrG